MYGSRSWVSSCPCLNPMISSFAESWLKNKKNNPNQPIINPLLPRPCCKVLSCCADISPFFLYFIFWSHFFSLNVEKRWSCLVRNCCLFRKVSLMCYREAEKDFIPIECQKTTVVFFSATELWSLTKENIPVMKLIWVICVALVRNKRSWLLTPQETHQTHLLCNGFVRM